MGGGNRQSTGLANSVMYDGYTPNYPGCNSAHEGLFDKPGNVLSNRALVKLGELITISGART